MTNKEYLWLCGIVFCIILIVLAVGHELRLNYMDARLDKLEAASTTAQQPQERHYFKTVDSMGIQDFPIGKSHAMILTNKNCHAGDTVWPMYYKIK